MKPFKAKVRNVAGTSYGPTIPKAYIDNGLYKEGVEYEWEGKEVKQKEVNEQ